MAWGCASSASESAPNRQRSRGVPRVNHNPEGVVVWSSLKVLKLIAAAECQHPCYTKICKCYNPQAPKAGIN
eukprot:4942469-Amphidinium_carterae.1